jgi:hypothetical protein
MYFSILVYIIFIDVYIYYTLERFWAEEWWKTVLLLIGKRLLLGGRDVNDGCAAWWERDG